MLRVVATVMRKEFIQTLRDPHMLVILFIAPAIQCLIFGYAVNLDLVAQPTVIVDSDRTPASREVVRLLRNSDGFQVIAVHGSEAEADRAVLRGEASVALYIPRGYGKALDQMAAELLVVVDGSDANTAVLAGQEIGQILTDRVIGQQKARIGTMLIGMGRSPDQVLRTVRVDPRAWFNPQLRNAVFFVPGVLCTLLLLTTMMLTSLGLTREKEIGTLEQVMVSPLRPYELIMGKTLPFAIFGMLEVVLVISVAVLVFDVPVRGSVPALFGVSAVFLLTTLGFGLFISTISETQQQAMLNCVFVLLPAIVLSGFIFPIAQMPEPVQWLTLANPMRYYMEIVRGLMVKGSDMAQLTESLGALVLLGIAVFTGASLRFRKRVA